MKTNLISRIIVFVACVFGLVATASAQSPSSMKVNIPFEFKLQTNTLPAGTYLVRRVYADSDRLLLLQEVTGVRSQFVNCTEIKSVEKPMKPALIFHRYGDTYVLATIQSSKTRMVLPVTRVEKALYARTAKLEVVTISSR